MIRVGVIATCAALIIMAGIMIWTYGHLPVTGRIPIHYSNGGADGWAVDRGHAIGYFFFPMGLVWLLSLLFGVITQLAPKQSGLRRSLPVLIVIWIGVATLLTLVMGEVALQIVHRAGAVGVEPVPNTLGWIGAGVSILIIAIGNVLPKTRPNFLLGIRTPWTLSSPTTWDKTHRLGGPLVMLAGIAGLVGAFVFRDRWAILTGIAGMLSAACIAAAYSFIVWRSANDKGQRPEYLP
jgi:uncharacterized membrane protein